MVFFQSLRGTVGTLYQNQKLRIQNKKMLIQNQHVLNKQQEIDILDQELELHVILLLLYEVNLNVLDI
jgi:hypothetical protein